MRSTCAAFVGPKPPPLAVRTSPLPNFSVVEDLPIVNPAEKCGAGHAQLVTWLRNHLNVLGGGPVKLCGAKPSLEIGLSGLWVEDLLLPKATARSLVMPANSVGHRL